MPAKYSVSGQLGAVLALVLCGFAVPAIAAPSSAALLKGLTACQGVVEPQSRLACFDDLARRSLGSTAAQMPPASAAQPMASEAMTPSTAPKNQAAANTPAPSIAEASNAPSHPLDQISAKVDKLTLTIAKVETGRDGVLRLTTTDGTVLQQLDDIRNFSKFPSAGDSVTLLRRLLGYRCKINKRDYFICKPLGH
jgi:hypothetical protein